MQAVNDDYKKRRAERQKRIRRRRLIIGLMFFMITALAVLIVLCLTVFFPVRNIAAAGSKIYTAEQIVEACGITSEDNIFIFSSGKAADKLQKQLPYIENVKIERKLPGDVRITVTDAKEFVCYPVNGEYYSVSEKGRVLNKYEYCPSGLFTVRCDGVTCAPGEIIKFSDEKNEKTVKLMIESFAKQNVKINEINVTDPLSITAKVDGRFIVNFGTSGSIDKKIAHLGGMVKSIAPERTGRINLSMWSVKKTEGTFTEMPID